MQVKYTARPDWSKREGDLRSETCAGPGDRSHNRASDRTASNSIELDRDGKMKSGLANPMNYEEWSKSIELDRTFTRKRNGEFMTAKLNRTKEFSPRMNTELHGKNSRNSLRKTFDHESDESHELELRVLKRLLNYLISEDERRLVFQSIFTSFSGFRKPLKTL